jgi:hypothetical protein
MKPCIQAWHTTIWIFKEWSICQKWTTLECIHPWRIWQKIFVFYDSLVSLSFASFGWIWKVIVDQGVEEDSSLNIFKMTTNTNELVTKLFNRKLLIFKCYQVDVKSIKCPLQWCEKNESMFPKLIFMLDKS